MRRTTLVTPNGTRVQLLVPETDQEKILGVNIGVTAPYAGMLFHFDPQSVATMTMRNTPVGLYIAFIGPDRVVREVQYAAPHSGLYTSRHSPQPIRWVVETFRDWNLLRVGDRVRFEAL